MKGKEDQFKEPRKDSIGGRIDKEFERLREYYKQHPEADKAKGALEYFEFVQKLRPLPIEKRKPIPIRLLEQETVSGVITFYNTLSELKESFYKSANNPLAKIEDVIDHYYKTYISPAFTSKENKALKNKILSGAEVTTKSFEQECKLLTLQELIKFENFLSGLKFHKDLKEIHKGKEGYKDTYFSPISFTEFDFFHGDSLEKYKEAFRHNVKDKLTIEHELRQFKGFHKSARFFLDGKEDLTPEERFEFSLEADFYPEGLRLTLFNNSFEIIEFLENELKNFKEQTPAEADSKPKLSLRQIALFHVYKSEFITRENGDKIAEKYGYKSGEKLYQHFNSCYRKADRTGNPESKRKLTPKIKDLETVLLHLEGEQKAEAKADLNKLKSYLNDK